MNRKNGGFPQKIKKVLSIKSLVMKIYVDADADVVADVPKQFKNEQIPTRPI